MKLFKKIVCIFTALIAITINAYADVADPNLLFRDMPVYHERPIYFAEIVKIFGAVIVLILVAVYFIAWHFEKNKSDSNDEKNIENLKEESDEQNK